MSLEWSHSPEAYDNARGNLNRLPKKILIEIASEWKAFEASNPDSEFASASSSQLNDETYRAQARLYRKEINAGRLSLDTLAEFIWEQASRLRTCTNGGWDAWLCPFGCGCHMVSFSSLEEIRKENLAKARARKLQTKLKS